MRDLLVCYLFISYYLLFAFYLVDQKDKFPAWTFTKVPFRCRRFKFRTSNLLFCDSCTSTMYRIAMPITHSTQTTAMSALDPNSSTKPKELGKSCKTANLCLQMRKPWWSWTDLIRFQSFFWEIWTEFHIVPHLVPHDSAWSSHVSPSSDFQGT